MQKPEAHTIGQVTFSRKYLLHSLYIQYINKYVVLKKRGEGNVLMVRAV